MKVLQYLEMQKVNQALIHDVERFRENYPVEREAEYRWPASESGQSEGL